MGAVSRLGWLAVMLCTILAGPLDLDTRPQHAPEAQGPHLTGYVARKLQGSQSNASGAPTDAGGHWPPCHVATTPRHFPAALVAFLRWRRSVMARANRLLFGRGRAGHGFMTGSQTYLLPILIFGPNNQVTGLKEGMVLSRILGRTAILPSIHEHYTVLEDQKRRNLTAQGSYAFEDVFDAHDIKKFSEVVSTQQLLQEGWDGQLEALLYWHIKDLKYLDRVKASDNITVRDSARMFEMPGNRVCRTGYAYDLRKTLQKYRVVGVIIYNQILFRAREHSLDPSEVDDSREAQKCFNYYAQVTEHLHKAPYIRDIAREFINKHFYGGDFVAVHIRPYPDRCLGVWDTRTTLSGDFSMCENPNLHLQIADEATRALAKIRATGSAVFVATPPKAKSRINDLFQRKGLSPVYLSADFVHQALVRRGRAAPSSFLSGTLVMFVEQEICVQSRMFVGTLDSSITGMIRQERSAGKVPLVLNTVFGGMLEGLDEFADEGAALS